MYFVLLQMLPSAGPDSLWTGICSKSRSKAANGALSPGTPCKEAAEAGREPFPRQKENSVRQ